MILHNITTTLVIMVTMAFSATTRAALLEDFDGGWQHPIHPHTIGWRTGTVYRCWWTFWKLSTAHFADKFK